MSDSESDRLSFQGVDCFKRSRVVVSPTPSYFEQSDAEDGCVTNTDVRENEYVERPSDESMEIDEIENTTPETAEDAVRLRCKSSILKMFPWYTGCITSPRPLYDWLPDTNPFKTLGMRLESFLDIVNTSDDRDLSMIRDALEDRTDVPRPKVLGVHASSLLAAFRVYEMAVLIERGSEAQTDLVLHMKSKLPTTRIGKKNETTVNNWQTHWHQLGDWVEILQKARRAVASFGSLPDDYNNDDNSGTVQKLMNFMNITDEANHGLQIAKNFTYAALYINIINNNQAVDGLINIPDDVNRFLRLANSVSGGDNDLNLPAESGSKPRRSGKNSLILAALCSPLYLLSTSNLASTTFDKSACIMVSKALGNDQGPELQKVLKSIWSTLFDITLGKESPLRAVARLLNRLNWDALETDDVQSERYWYSKGFPTQTLDSYTDARIVGSDIARVDESDGENHDLELIAMIHSSSSTVTDKLVNDEDNDRTVEEKSLTRVLRSSKVTGEHNTELYEQSMRSGPSRTSRSRKSNKKNSKRAASANSEREPTPKKTRTSFEQNEALTRVQRALETVHNAGVRFRPIVIDDIEDDGMHTGWSCESSVVMFEYLDKFEKLVAVTARGSIIEVVPSSPVQDLVPVLAHNIRLSMKSSRDGAPYFLVSPIQTSISTFEKLAFDSLSCAAMARSYLLSPALVVTGNQVRHPSFDKTSLRDIVDLDIAVDVLDQTFFPHNESKAIMQSFNSNCFHIEHREGDRTKYSRSATFSDLLLCRESRKNVLYATEIKLPMGSIPTCFGSDMIAWKRAHAFPYPYCRDEAVPVKDIRWAEVGVKHAYRPWHITRNGWGTFLECTAGKMFVLLRVSFARSQTPRHPDSKIYRYIDHVNADGRVEGICLESGDTMYIHPNVSFSTLLLEDTICYGGYFYHHSTMLSTLLGYIHMMVAGDMVADRPTGDEALTSWDLLYRLLLFYHDIFVRGYEPETSTIEMHIPELETQSGMLSLYSLCALVMWSNAFSPLTYMNSGEIPIEIQTKYCVNAMPAFNRQKCAYMKKVARSLLQWTFNSYDIAPVEGLSGCTLYRSVFVPFIGHMISQVGLYMDMASSAKTPSLLPLDYRRQIETEMLDPFDEWPEVSEYAREVDEDQAGSLIVDIDADFSFVARKNAMPMMNCKNREHTPRDKIYFEGLDAKWEK